MKPHSKPVSAENANFINEMDGIIAGLKAGSPTVIDQCLNKINYFYEVLMKTGKFPPIVDKSLDYLYVDFFPQVVPLLMKLISPGSIAILSINIALFVSYKMEHGDPSSTKLVNLFFENKFLLEAFKNMERSEANQYNKTISGSVACYASNPGQCQFVINPPSQGVDFISITIQNCARRLLFTYFLNNLKNLKSFESFADVAKMFEYCTDILHPNFRKFLFDYFEKNIIKKVGNDCRFNSPSSLYIHRILFMIAMDSRMRRPFSELYFTAITKFFLNGYIDQPLYEVRFIMKRIEKPEAKIIAFLSSFLEVVFHQYKDEYNEIIKEIVYYLKDHNRLEKELICTALIGKWELFVNLYSFLEDSFDYNILYNKLKGENELTPSMANSLLLIIPKLKRQIDETAEIMRAMKFSDETSIPFLSKLTDLDDTDGLTDAINETVVNKEIQKSVTAQIICKITQENGLSIDFQSLSDLIIGLMSGKELLQIFIDYDFLIVSDLSLFVHKVGKEERLLRFLRENFITQVYMVEKELSLFNPSQELIKLLFESFIISNEIDDNFIPHESDRKLKYFSLLYDSLVISSKKFRNDFERIKEFAQNLIKYQPSLVVNYVLNEINYNPDFHKTLITIQALKFSKVPADLILSKIGIVTEKNLFALFLFRKSLKGQSKEIECENDTVKIFYQSLMGNSSDALKNWQSLFLYENPIPLIKSVVFAILLLVHLECDNNDHSEEHESRIQAINEKLPSLMQLSIDCQFYPLLKILLDHFKVEIVPRKVSNLPYFFYKVLYKSLISNEKTDIYGLAAALKFSETSSIPYVMKKINEMPDKDVSRISTQIIAEYQRIDNSGVLMRALKKLPKSINKFLVLTFFFNPQLCPIIRTKEVLRTFFSLFYEDTLQILKFYETNKCASISFDRCGFDDLSYNSSISSIFQVFSSIVPLYDRYYSIENKFMDILKLLEFSDQPFFTGSIDDPFFDEERDASECWEHVISSMLSSEQQKLFQFEMNHTIQHTVFLPSSVKSIDNYLNENCMNFAEFPSVLCFKFEKTVTLDQIESSLDSKTPPQSEDDDDAENDDADNRCYFNYNLQAIVYYENEKFFSVVKNGLGQFVQCRCKFCEIIEELPKSNVYMVIYQKSDRWTDAITASTIWNSLPESERKSIAPIFLSATKAVNSSSIDWTRFNLDRNYLSFAILMYKKYEVSIPLDVLALSNNFPEYVYHILFEENDFQFFFNAPEFFTRIMLTYPDRNKLIKTLLSFKADNPNTFCALCLLFSIKMTPAEAFDILLNFDEKVLSHATTVPSFPHFFFYALKSNPDKKDVQKLLKYDSVKSTILPLDDYSLIPFLIPITEGVLRAIIAYSSKEFVTELLKQAKSQNNS